MKIWISSDFHYNHTNIIKGISKWDNINRCRDFETLKDYNSTLVNNINAVVGENDILYHLGDWSFGGAQEIWKFREKLKCRTIHCLLGNHDHHIKRNKVLNTGKGHINARDLFASVNDLVDKDLKGLNNFVMCHYPILSWHRKKAGAIHLYGHTHQELNFHPRAFCVSIDCHPEFRPFLLEEIIELINQRDATNDEEYFSGTSDQG